MPDATLKMILLGEDRGASKAIKHVGDEAKRTETKGSKIGSAFGKSASGVGKMVGAFAGLAIAGKAVGFLKESVAEARESQKVGAITTQVIKTTGKAAKISAGQVGDLATAISNKTGIDDEAIQSGANLLLTFKGIKNEAGKGNDIFNQTTGIMTDMAAAMGKDPKSAAIGLGKALNDPIKGVTALSKVGVTFDAGQKKQIATMMKHKNVAGAQKIILKELKSEFGGAAAASATSGEKAAVAWGNLKEMIGTKLLPIIDKLENWISQKVIPAVTKFFNEMSSGVGTGGQVADILAKVGETLGTVVGFLAKHKETVITFVAVLGAMAIAFAAVNAVMAVNPISLVIIAIAALVTGLIMAYRHSETFRTVVNGAFKGVASAAQGMWAVIKPVFRFILNYWLAVAGGIINGAARAFGWVPGLGPKLRRAADWFNDFKKDVNRALDGTKDRKKITFSTPGADTAISNLRTIKRLMHDIRSAKPARTPTGGGLIGAGLGRNAVGASFWRGGATVVGERGPEIVYAPRGASIDPHPRARAASAPAEGGHYTIDLRLDGKVIQSILLKEKRRNGGTSLGLA